MEHVEIIVEDLPELETEVGVAGTTHLEEVGGAICFALLVGIVVGL